MTRFHDLRLFCRVLPLTASIACSSAPDPATPDRGHAPMGSLVNAPLGEFPERLSEAGLYLDLPSRQEVAIEAVPYRPAWPLWSNGLAKDRFIVVPEGEAISADDDAWSFPVGTLFFKTFSETETERPIETRVIRLGEDGFEFNVYQWDTEATDAERLDLTRSTAVEVEDAAGEPFEHRIPSRTQCRQCHESSEVAVLGFTELQLGSQGELEKPELERDAIADLFETTPEPLAEPFDDDATTNRVLGYFVGNCSGCHNASGGPSSAFDLRPDVALANILDVPTMSSQTAPGMRVTPGSPEDSILFLAVSGETDNPEVKTMPPVGVQVRDADAVELLREWISGL
jgi:hypothetical protein